MELKEHLVRKQKPIWWPHFLLKIDLEHPQYRPNTGHGSNFLKTTTHEDFAQLAQNETETITLISVLFVMQLSGTMSSTGVPLTGRAVVIAQEDLDEANAKEEFKKVHKAWAKYFNLKDNEV